MDSITNPNFRTFPKKDGIALGGILIYGRMAGYVLSNINVNLNSFILYSSGSVNGWSGSMGLGFDYDDLGRYNNYYIDSKGYISSIFA